MLMERLAGEMEPDRAVELIEAGAEPLQDLIAALHTKLLVAELERHRAARREGDGGRPPSSRARRPGSAAPPPCTSTRSAPRSSPACARTPTPSRCATPVPSASSR